MSAGPGDGGAAGEPRRRTPAAFFVLPIVLVALLLGGLRECGRSHAPSSPGAPAGR